jgi:hypothetical protein
VHCFRQSFLRVLILPVHCFRQSFLRAGFAEEPFSRAPVGEQAVCKRADPFAASAAVLAE